MSTDRWRRIEELYHAAYGRPAKERAAFLDEVCADDARLRQEVESLLVQRVSSDGLLEHPALGVATPTGPMPFPMGRRLGPYEITGPLGSGGMGEVYRARDHELNRDVAVKVLPELFALDAGRVTRLRREARVLASLNHPNIGAIYGLQDADGMCALVLELVEGPTLADRIARGPIPLAEALPIARQVCEAVEAAHEHGVVHRDLKPANIKLRPDGVVKVLDFGLAKVLVSDGSGVDPSPAATVTASATREGLILGTAAYMSPEQARGQAVDQRADVWAFGCVLYEMLTGRPAFAGESVTDVLACIIEREVDFNLLPSTTPPPIRRVLRRSLEKDRKRRLSDIADARIEIDDALTTTSADASAVTPANVYPAGWRRGVPWAVAFAAVAIAAAVLAFWPPWQTGPPPAPLRLTADLGADASLATGMGLNAIVGTSVVLSPDGTLFAFVAQKIGTQTSQLYVRRLEQLQATPLTGTEEAANPFFSPDNQWIAFFAQGKLKKISTTGGAVVTLCDAANGRGGSWGEDGTIVFTPSVAGAGLFLWRVPSTGGKPEPLAKPGDAEVTQRWPQILPGGKAVLYTGNTDVGGYEDANLVVQPLPTGARKIVHRGGYHGRYLPSGHLVYIHDGILFAASFDVTRLEMTGQPVSVLEGVTSNPSTGATQFAASDTGTIVYLPGRRTSGAVPIHVIDQEGTTTPLRTAPATWSSPAFAPDGGRLAMTISDGQQQDVWVYQSAGDALSRLTFDAADARNPVWTPDGRHIVFASRRADDSASNLYWQRTDGTSGIQRLTDSGNTQLPGSWHPNGRFLAFTETHPHTNADLMMVAMDGDEASGWKPGTPTVLLNGPFIELDPQFSPDGRWLAYASNESGRPEVYVRPFPDAGGKWQVSTDGGNEPVWSRSRNELFFKALNNRIMVASYMVKGNSFRAVKSRLWSETRFTPRDPRQRAFDLHPDGERIALAAVPEPPVALRQEKVVFIFNFFDELRRIAPAGQR
jgi:Tol biopolymer transport system component